MNRTKHLVAAIVPGMNQLKRRGDTAYAAATARLEAMTAEGELRKTMWRHDVNPWRPDRPQPEVGKRKQEREAERLVLATTSAADRLRESAIMIRKARDEAHRAAAATIGNLEMLDAAMNLVKRGVQGAREATKHFRACRANERKFNPQNVPTEGDRPTKVRQTKAGPVKKGTNMAGKKSEGPSVDQLLKQLKSTTDQVEKSKLRAKLRTRGHNGGTGEGRGRSKKKVAKKGRRAKTAA